MMQRTTGPGRYDRSLTTAQRTGTRHEALLDAATDVFAARGYSGTRVEDIVDRSGISRRTLYQHFPSLDALLAQIYDRAVRLSFTMVLERLMTITDPIERVHAGVAAFLGLLIEHPAAARVVFEVYRNAGPTQAAQHELNTARYANVMFDFLNVAYAAGRLARRPDEAMVYALSKGLEAVGVRALQRGEQETLRALAPRISAMVIDAFGGATS